MIINISAQSPAHGQASVCLTPGSDSHVTDLLAQGDEIVLAGCHTWTASPSHVLQDGGGEEVEEEEEEDGRRRDEEVCMTGAEKWLIWSAESGCWCQSQSVWGSRKCFRPAPGVGDGCQRALHLTTLQMHKHAGYPSHTQESEGLIISVEQREENLCL